MSDLSSEEENIKILTVREVNFDGKWIEFRFEEHEELCTKAHMAFDKVKESGMIGVDTRGEWEWENWDGFDGKKTKWIYISPNWELVEIYADKLKNT